MTGADSHASGRAGKRLPWLLQWMLATPLLFAAFVDLPQLLRVGPVSGLGALTIIQAALACGALLACRYLPTRVLFRVLPYLALLVWAGMTSLWAPPNFGGVQNALVYLLFGLLLVTAGSLSARNPLRMHQLIDRSVRWLDWVGLGLVVSNVVVNGLHNPAAESWLVGPRSLALVGLLPLSWHLAQWYHNRGKSVLPACLWLSAIFVSQSRTTTAASLLLVTIVFVLQLQFRPRRTAGSLSLLVLSVAVVAATVLYAAPFRQRFLSDQAGPEVGSVRLKIAGRSEIWSAVVASARKSPVLGQGMGSSQTATVSEFGDLIGHPHNDYLRVWHDLGAIGVSLFVLSLGCWFTILFRDWYWAERLRDTRAEMMLAAFLALLGVALGMVTDNAIIYPFVMGPLGVLLGAGLGARARLYTTHPPRSSQLPVAHVGAVARYSNRASRSGARRRRRHPRWSGLRKLFALR